MISQSPVVMKSNTFDDESTLLDRVVKSGGVKLEKADVPSGITIWQKTSERFWGSGRVSQKDIVAFSDIAGLVSSAAQPPELDETRRTPLYQRGGREVAGRQLISGVKVKTIKTAEVSILLDAILVEEKVRYDVQYSDDYIQDLLCKSDAEKEETGAVGTHLLNEIRSVVTELESRDRLTPRQGGYLGRLHSHLPL